MTLLSSHQYTLLDNGMRSQVTETRLKLNSTTSTRTIDYTHDVLGRLLSEMVG